MFDKDIYPNWTVDFVSHGLKFLYFEKIKSMVEQYKGLKKTSWYSSNIN